MGQETQAGECWASHKQPVQKTSCTERTRQKYTGLIYKQHFHYKSEEIIN